MSTRRVLLDKFSLRKLLFVAIFWHDNMCTNLSPFYDVIRKCLSLSWGKTSPVVLFSAVVAIVSLKMVCNVYLTEEFVKKQLTNGLAGQVICTVIVYFPWFMASKVISCYFLSFTLLQPA